MKTLDLVQGSADWHAHRSNPKIRNASDAPAAMGASKHQSRSDLIRKIATGVVEDVSPHLQALFDRGHAAEASIRPHIEKIVGEDLYPATGVSDEFPEMSASFDGITMDETIIFEHKLLNAELFRAVTNGDELDMNYAWQIEHQLLVSGADKCIFVTSDGTPENMAYCWYTAVPGRREALLAGWAQLEKDVAAYVHEAAVPVAVAAPIMDLPAVNVNIEGALQVLSNLPEFGSRLRTFIDGLNPTPESDQDFADAENEIKVLKRAEDELQAAEDRALSQISVVDEMRKTKAMLHKLARDTRLAREKLVKDRKEFVRAQIQASAVAQVTAHIAEIDRRLGASYLPAIPHDIAGAMKGKKTMASLKDAAATAVAKWKIEADAVAKVIEINLATLEERAGHAFLFNDRKSLVLKDPEAVVAIVDQRIAAHEAEQRQKAEAAAEAAREKIRKEEQAKAEAAAQARADEERKQREATEQKAAKCDGNHGGPRCADPECRNDSPAKQDAVAKAADNYGGIEKTVVHESAPAPAAVAQIPAPVVKPRVKIDPRRPTDSEILSAVMAHFNVERSVAASWLLTMNAAELAKAAA